MTVDGRQVGGVQTASASHAAGQWQDVTLTGDFGSDPSKVAVTFTNDAWGGTAATDRNLYVQSLTLNGRTYAGSAVPNALGPSTPDGAALYAGGTITFDTAGSAAAPSPVVVPPAAPVVAGFAAPLTASAEPAISGTAAAGAKVSVYLDGATVPLATVTATAAGAWSYVPTRALADGAHSFTAQATNAAGQASALSAAQSVTIDTTPPSERVKTLSVAGDDAIDSVEARGGVVVTGTLSAPLAAGDSLVVSIGGVSTTVPTAKVQGTAFSFTAAKPAAGWTAGTATASVRDAAGNASAAAAQGYTAPPAPSGTMALLGVNLSGGEYSADKLPGVMGTNYTYPTHDEVDYYASKGLNVIRLPFLWERLQPTEGGPLSQTELNRIDDVVDYANSKGMKVILDPHNYGSGYGSLIGSSATPNSAFADFWGKLAGHYASNGDVMFGLMNEPQQAHAADWLSAANAAIQAIRQAGATAQEVLVPGAYWDGAATWTTTDNASVVGTGIKDPANNFVFEMHQYLDFDGSGTHDSVVSPTIGSSRLAAVTQWAQSTGNKLFLGEFGVGQDATSVSAMNDMLGFMKQHSDVWQGAADWLGGPWVGDNIYTIEPGGLGTGHVTDKPQMGVLQHYAPGTF